MTVGCQRHLFANLTVRLLCSSRVHLLTIPAGLTYCAIGALTFLNRFSSDKPAPVVSPGSEEFESLVRWLVARQTSDLGENDEEQPTRSDKTQENLSQAVEALRLKGKVEALPPIETPTEESLQWAGFNGRSNKAADTCYSFWNTATLAVSYFSDEIGRLRLTR